jgi:hypothetical protein
VPGAALHLTPGPDMGTQAREIDGLVVRVKVTIDLRSRHSTKRMHAVQGLWRTLGALPLHLTPAL